VKTRGRIGLIAGLVVILGGFSFLLYGGIGENLVYFVTPSELAARGDQAVDTPVRLGGMVVPGSVRWDADALDLRFRMTDGEMEIEVHSRKAPPQMFREGLGVVVEGRLTRSGTFESSNVMVKHSNEYKPPTDGAHADDAYRTLLETES
jgi:cytochrome c-type biogenesis protein CcmE